MQITFLGTGTPLVEVHRQATATLIQMQRFNLLFDAGRGVNAQLLRASVLPTAIDVIFLTHHHWDHIGDMGDVIMAAWHGGRTSPMTILGPKGTRRIVDALLGVVFQRDIQFTVLSEAKQGNTLIPIEEFVKVIEVVPGICFKEGGTSVSCEYVDHGSRLGLSEADWPCLGYRVEERGKIVTVSGDTIPCSGIATLAYGADVLIHVCYLADAELTTAATQFLTENIIASSGQVARVAAQAKAKTLVLTHIRNRTADVWKTIPQEITDTFSGKVLIADDLMVLDV